MGGLNVNCPPATRTLLQYPTRIQPPTRIAWSTPLEHTFSTVTSTVWIPGGYPQMINIASLLDKAKVIHSLKSDYKLALVMGVQQSSLRNYRTGKTLPDERVIGKICDLTGDDPGLLLAEIEAQRAKSDEARAMWTDIAKRLSAAAAVGILSASALAGPTLPPAPSTNPMYLMLSGSFSRSVRLRRRAHTREKLLHATC